MSQLAWPHILSVALRLKVSEALLLSEHSLDIYMSDEHSVAVLDEFQAIAAGELAIAGRTYRTPRDVAEEGPAIDAYLKRVGDSLALRAARLAAKSAHARQLLHAIVTACGTAMCQPCSGANACAWTINSSAADRERVASGECTRPVRELFAWVCNVVAQRYRLAGVKHNAKAPQLVTGHSTCRNADLELAIHASTHRGPKRGSREIKMVFHPDSLWVPDYLSLAYIFAHEFTAHAWCGVNVEASEAEDSKAFHEGWMDSVAAAILRSALNNRSLAPPSHAIEIWAQTRDVRGVRLHTSRPSPPADVWQWNIGVRAFETLQFLYAQTVGAGVIEDDENAWSRASARSLQATIDLSLRINASAISHRQRRHFVQSLLHHYARSNATARAKALAQRIQIIDYLEKYDKTHDEGTFVRQVVALSR